MAQAAAEEDADDVSRLGLEVGAGRSRPVGWRRLQVPTAEQEVDGRIAGRPEAASRRKSRRVEGAVVWARVSGGSDRRAVGPSIDGEDFVRVEQHEAELVEALLRDEAPRGLARDRRRAGRTPAASRSDLPAASSPASRRRRAANRAANFSMNELFVKESAWMGVIVCVRLRRHDRRAGDPTCRASVAPRPRPEAVDCPAIDRLGELSARVGELVVGLGPFPLSLTSWKLGPPTFRVQRPGDRQAASRTASPSSRLRLALQSRRFSASIPSARSPRDARLRPVRRGDDGEPGISLSVHPPRMNRGG